MDAMAGLECRDLGAQKGAETLPKCRRPRASSARGRGNAGATLSVLVDDRTHVLARESPRDHAFFEAVHDLELVAEAGARQVVDDDRFEDRVLEVRRDQLLRPDAGDELRLRVLLRVVLV